MDSSLEAWKVGVESSPSAIRVLSPHDSYTRFLRMTSYSLAAEAEVSYSFASDVAPVMHLFGPRTFHIFMGLKRTMPQRELKREKRYWYVRPDGTNLIAVVRNIRKAFYEQALPFYEKYLSLESTLAALLKGEEPDPDRLVQTYEHGSTLWGELVERSR